MSEPDLYAALDVPPDADEAEIRRAYQKLARRHHPDLAPGDAEGARRFAAAARAFEVLSDPELRRSYDRLREAGEAEEWVEEQWRSVDEVVAQVDGGGVMRSSRRVEVRRQVRRRPPPAERPRPVDEAVVEVTIDFAEAVRGATRSFPLQREEVCPDCGGAGRRGGEGCERCGGRGALIELERVRVRLPRAIEDGDRLRVEGKGRPLGPGRQGDLVLVVRVHPHAYFRRDGLDVHADLPISLAEALFGAEVEVPTVDGPVRVRIPPNTSGGRVLRLRGRGIAPPGGDPGDHYARLTLRLPQRIADDLREALRRQPAEDPRRGLPREGV
jgi:DnaJ-class molecular chaperone